MYVLGKSNVLSDTYRSKNFVRSAFHTEDKYYKLKFKKKRLLVVINVKKNNWLKGNNNFSATKIILIKFLTLLIAHISIFHGNRVKQQNLCFRTLHRARWKLISQFFSNSVYRKTTSEFKLRISKAGAS